MTIADGICMNLVFDLSLLFLFFVEKEFRLCKLLVNENIILSVFTLAIRKDIAIAY